MFPPTPQIKERSGPEGHRAPEQPSPRTAQNETTSGPRSRKYNFLATPWHRCARRSALGRHRPTLYANFCTQGELSNLSFVPKSIIWHDLSPAGPLAWRMQSTTCSSSFR